MNPEKGVENLAEILGAFADERAVIPSGIFEKRG